VLTKVVIFLLVVFNFIKDFPPLPADTIPQPAAPKIAPSEIYVEPEALTEKLYCLEASANVRGGPGTNYKAVDKLYFFDEVVVETKFYGKDDAWRKIVGDGYEYIHSSLLGTVQQCRDKFCDAVDSDIRKLKKLGVIKRVKLAQIFVNKYLWDQYSLYDRQEFCKLFATMYQIRHGVRACVIKNDLNGAVIMTERPYGL
jgi:hypothetical protein